MEFMTKNLVLALFLACFMASPAQADPKFMHITWYSDHWVDQDFIPYYQNGTDPHNNQWDKSTWKPADWVEMNGGNGAALISKWHKVDILEGRDSKNGAPVVDVGVNFYHLSGYDKGRVMATLDHVYNITNTSPRMFYLRDSQTEKIIGYYSKAGLSLH